MKKIIIKDTSVPYLNAVETPEYYDNATRRVLTVTCAPNAIGVDDLNALLTEDNLASITMANDKADVVDENGAPAKGTVTNVYDGYVIKMECGIRRVQTEPETPEAPAQYADRLVFKLGRRTYIEQKLHELSL